MVASTEFYSILSQTREELVVKGSRFIAHAAPVADRVEAEDFVDAISQKFSDATHNCFAYKIGLGDAGAFRSSDDGEPSGTAGRPILQAIDANELTDVAVVVTRYFGGTKLGTGGLIRAYGGAAQAALRLAEIVVHQLKTTVNLRFDYSLTNPVRQILERFQAEILENSFGRDIFYCVQINVGDEALFRRELVDTTSGKIVFEKAASEKS